jgi:hypothetical protein
MGETGQLSEFEQQCLDVVNEGGYTSYQFVAQRVGRGNLLVKVKGKLCVVYDELVYSKYCWSL